MTSRARLVRWVAANGHLLVDGQRKSAGRGIYLCATRVCIARARRSKRLPAGIKLNVELLCESAFGELGRRIDRLLLAGAARRQLIMGFGSVERELKPIAQSESTPYSVLIADDLSPKRTRRLVVDTTRRYVDRVNYGTKKRLGELLGKQDIGAIAFADVTLFQELRELVSLRQALIPRKS